MQLSIKAPDRTYNSGEPAKIRAADSFIVAVCSVGVCKRILATVGHEVTRTSVMMERNKVSLLFTEHNCSKYSCVSKTTIVQSKM